MKVVDANVLLYAVNASAAHHRAAHGWMAGALSGGDVVGLPWVSLLAFLRLATHPRVFPTPLSVGQAMDVVETWQASPSVVVAEPTTRHARVLRGLLEQAGSAGNLTIDAHVAALCVEHGGSVVTFDRDFGRFGVPVLVPGA